MKPVFSSTKLCWPWFNIELSIHKSGKIERLGPSKRRTMRCLLLRFFFFFAVFLFSLCCAVSLLLFFTLFFFLYLLYAPLINCLFSMCVCSSFTPQGILSLTGGESGVSLYSLTTVTCAAYVFKFVFFSVCRIK